VIFDLDGTLVDSAGEICDALAGAFREAGLEPLDRDAVSRLVGRGVRSLVERALAERKAPEARIAPILESFESHYARTVGTGALLFPGVREGLGALHAAGRRLAVVTNKPRDFTLKLLRHLGIDAMFDAIVAGGEGLLAKPAGDMLLAACERLGSKPGATLMIGDSQIDVQAARAAGCTVWCVPYGYNEGRPPESLDADRLVGDVQEAARLILADA